MSVDDVMKYRSAYEKMLESGKAYEKVDMPNVMTPEALGEKPDIPLGEETKVEKKMIQDDEPDFSEVDRRMQERLKARMNSLKSKTNDSELVKEVKSLRKRVETLEEALSLIMETQEKLLGD